MLDLVLRAAAAQRAIGLALLELAPDLRYLGLALAHGCLKRRQSRRAARSFAIWRPVELAVEPVQLLAQLAQTIKHARLERVAWLLGQLHRAAQHIHQRARALLFDIAQRLGDSVGAALRQA
jgi:hypothetical protein